MVSESETIRWVARPIAIEPWTRSAALVAVIAGTVGLSWLIAPLFGVVAAVLLPIGMGPYFLATGYELSGSGVKVSFPLFPRSRPWNVYKRYVVQKDGVFLSPFAQPSRLDSFRGDFLRFAPGVDRDRVMALVRKHVSVEWTGKG